LPQKRNKAAGGRAKASKDEGNVLIKQLSQTPKDLRLNVMVEFVKQVVIRVLVRDQDADFDIHMPLTDMGMDSLMVRELSNILGQQVGKKRGSPSPWPTTTPTWLLLPASCCRA
jgi:hypothetical protein